MDIHKLPLNQKTTIIAKKFLIATATKVSNDEAIISYIDLKTRQEVLRFLQREGKNIQIIEYVDDDYWHIYTDGKKVNKCDFSFLKNSKINMKINTTGKRLELRIINKNKRTLPKSKEPVELHYKQLK